jgi:hypothetical protein
LVPKDRKILRVGAGDPGQTVRGEQPHRVGAAKILAGLVTREVGSICVERGFGS